MTMKRLGLSAALLASLWLAGCGAGTLIGLVGDLTGGGDDGDFVQAISDVSHAWQVTNYSGPAVGAVTVPAVADLVWDIDSDFTFTVNSDQAVSIGGATSLLYDEAGTWRMVDAKTGQIAFTLTRHAGANVPSVNRDEASGLYALTVTNW